MTALFGVGRVSTPLRAYTYVVYPIFG